MLRDTATSSDIFQPKTIQPLRDILPFIAGRSVLENNSFRSVIKYQKKINIRETTVGDQVDCYRNLRKQELFSCKQVSGENKGLVSGYGRMIILGDVSFKVSEASRQTVLKVKQKNVHAFVRGEFIDCFDGEVIEGCDLIAVTYNPYIGDWFFRRDTGEPIQRSATSRFAILSGSNVYLTNL
ncbi:MAG: hypothetical protein HAW67_07405 [Endozoicomonadaceae bacterium]|nr:hypothetical protein [Endozoicomonadaceae bacterium]